MLMLLYSRKLIFSFNLLLEKKKKAMVNEFNRLCLILKGVSLYPVFTVKSNLLLKSFTIKAYTAIQHRLQQFFPQEDAACHFFPVSLKA